MCLRRTPTALGSDVVCSTNLEEVVVDQAENKRCCHQLDGDGVGASRRGALPGLRFLCSKADARHLASFGVRRETLSVRQRLQMRAAGPAAPTGRRKRDKGDTCACIVVYGRCHYNMNVKIIIKPQKSQFLRLTYFLTANFRDFEVYDIHLAENIVVIRGPRACGDDPTGGKPWKAVILWTPRMRG